MVIDGIVAVILLISALIAFLRGFIREILTIFGIMGGIAAAYFGGPLLAPYVKDWLGVVEGEEPEMLFGLVDYATVGNIVAYTALLVVFVVIFSVISHFISEFAKTIGLGAIDRTLGVVFGLVRGILLLGLLYLPFYYLAGPEQEKEWFADSRTHVYMKATSAWIAGFIPQEARETAQEGLQKLEDTSEARKKLEELDLLGTGGGGENEDEKPEKQNSKDGYSEDFRENMNRLFEQSTEDEKPPLHNQ